MTPFFQLLQQRVSAYGFSDSHISESELHYLIKAASHAPSAYHLQNWHFLPSVQKKPSKLYITLHFASIKLCRPPQ
ncbi:nitroreductase family protein [Neisseria wadsworthii]|uniref:nitroreductase family protein n=1 Tax=Neisseria wadsworthii TaxID=607711 RepID=UPI000D2F78C2|nr:nitroreductase family protein [Neisseria wadsworthii]